MAGHMKTDGAFDVFREGIYALAGTGVGDKACGCGQSILGRLPCIFFFYLSGFLYTPLLLD